MRYPLNEWQPAAKLLLENVAVRLQELILSLGSAATLSGIFLFLFCGFLCVLISLLVATVFLCALLYPINVRVEVLALIFVIFLLGLFSLSNRALFFLNHVYFARTLIAICLATSSLGTLCRLRSLASTRFLDLL